MNVGVVVECLSEIAEAVFLERLPDYDLLYKILYDHLYPDGDRSPRIVYRWLTDQQKAIASKIHIVPIQSIHFPAHKP